MANSSIIIIILLMVCCLVLGFLSYDFFMVTPPPSVLNCPKDNINLSCPKPDIHFECPEIPEPIECPDCECAQCYHVEERYTSHFQEIISSVFKERDYEYNHGNWNCDEMSDEVKDRLNNAGYKCKTDVGLYNNGTDSIKHQWTVCNHLIIEATNGQIIHPDEYWRYR